MPTPASAASAAPSASSRARPQLSQDDNMKDHPSKKQNQSARHGYLGKSGSIQEDVGKAEREQRLDKKEKEFKMKHLGVVGIFLWIL
jgi:hypothetical protein